MFNHSDEPVGFIIRAEGRHYMIIMHSLHVVLVFREDSQNELSFFIGLKCGRNNAIHSRW
jgi:hypothetical protein